MTPSSLAFAGLLGLAILPLSARAQDHPLSLETEEYSRVIVAAREQIWNRYQLEPSGQKAPSALDIPAFKLANREEILARYEEARRSLEELSAIGPSMLPHQDVESGAEFQRSQYRSTSLGSAGGFFSATLGVKGMQEKSAWSPLDSQGVASVEFAWRIPRSAFAGVVGLAGSYARQNRNSSVVGGEIDTWQTELYFGSKGYLEIPNSSIWGYAGLGVSLVYADIEGGILSASGATYRSTDFGIGAYAQLGLLLRLNQDQSIGIEYRGLFGTNTSFFNTDLSMDYNQVSFVFLVAF